MLWIPKGEEFFGDRRGGRWKIEVDHDGLRFPAFQAHYQRKHCCSCIFLLPFCTLNPNLVTGQLGVNATKIYRNDSIINLVVHEEECTCGHGY